jgi:hypothetical protein
MIGLGVLLNNFPPGYHVDQFLRRLKNVALLPRLRISRFDNIRNSRRVSPRALVSVLPQDDMKGWNEVTKQDAPQREDSLGHFSSASGLTYMGWLMAGKPLLSASFRQLQFCLSLVDWVIKVSELFEHSQTMVEFDADLDISTDP